MGRRKRMSDDQSGSDVLGQRLRALRQQRGLTLAELGQATGLSHSFLSQVETGKAHPSVSSLWEIAEALDAAPAELLAATRSANPLVVRRGEGHVLPTPDEQPHAIVRAHTDAHHLKAATVTGCFGTTSTMSHDGEEFIYVIAGALELTIDETPVTLGRGDTIVFDCSRPHRYATVGPGRDSPPPRRDPARGRRSTARGRRVHAPSGGDVRSLTSTLVTDC